MYDHHVVVDSSWPMVIGYLMIHKIAGWWWWINSKNTSSCWWNCAVGILGCAWPGTPGPIPRLAGDAGLHPRLREKLQVRLFQRVTETQTEKWLVERLQLTVPTHGCFMVVERLQLMVACLATVSFVFKWTSTSINRSSWREWFLYNHVVWHNNG